MSSVQIHIIGLKELVELFEEMDRKTGKRNLQKAVADSAKKVLKPQVKAQTPWPSYKRAVRAGAAKRGKPAGIVKYDNKRAPFRHIMLGGSTDHRTKRVRPNKSDIQAFNDGGTEKFSRGHRVRGVTGDPVITRVADQYGDNALEHVEEYLLRQLKLD